MFGDSFGNDSVVSKLTAVLDGYIIYIELWQVRLVV